ncbi:MAG: bifunctional oligoribonuclease/PAP phosphatase NrnA [Ruminococcaceae bacterium]|nr:bifunctional oligoribonuclease/PAP phosphatase NrnA [Oscillospiraceae bacterium]
MDKKSIDANKAAQLIKENDNILIIVHDDPDGDTLGSGYALWWVLQNAGKRIRVISPSEISYRYKFLENFYKENVKDDDFEPDYIISVDIASASLFGKLRHLADKVDLAIDHHVGNSLYAKHTYLNTEHSSCAEAVYDVIKENWEIDRFTAEAIYTGLSTDTGCFRFGNTTANSHIVAAEMIDTGFDVAMVNKLLFETTTKAQIHLERMALDTLEFYYHDKIAMLTVTLDIMELSGAHESDMTFINPIPRRFEGVEVGVVFRELKNGNVKASLRSAGKVRVNLICEKFGGGGHEAAAGFEVSGEMIDIKAAVVNEVIRHLKGE